MKRIVGWLMLLCLMVACGNPDQGPPLGAFAAITKTETDAPFNIVPPSSKSPAGFHYTSSNLAVATIAGSLVTIKGPGQSTITAAQDSVGGWGPTSASTTLTVTAVACSNSNEVRINGVCTPVPSCTAPATLQNNQCIPPVNNAALVHTSSLAWMGVSFSANWTNASAYCKSTTIAGATGDWRLPTTAELKDLVASGAIAGQGWTVGYTWSVDMGVASSVPTHVAVDLASGATAERPDAAGAYVTCVR